MPIKRVVVGAIARHRDGAVADDEDFEGHTFERMPLGDAINLLLHRGGIGVDEDGNHFCENPPVLAFEGKTAVL